MEKPRPEAESQFIPRSPESVDKELGAKSHSSTRERLVPLLGHVVDAEIKTAPEEAIDRGTPRAEAAFERSREAAEHDEPIEKQYELRHEVKDPQNDPKSFAQGATHIGDLLPTDMSTSAYTPIDDNQPTGTISKIRSVLRHAPYRRAAIIGFSTAILTLVLIVGLAVLL